MNALKRIGIEIKILTLNKLLTRLPVLLAQITAETNSYKLKTTKLDKYYIFCINRIKSPKKKLQ